MTARASALHRELAAEQWAKAPAARIELDIPRPPSVNSLYANLPGKGRRKTDRYRTWLSAAGWSVQAQRPGHIAGPYDLTVLVQPKSWGRQPDISNLVKAAEDLLVKHGVIDDDRHARSASVRWDESVSGARVIVEAAA